MADLIDQLRERAERAERERAEAKALAEEWEEAVAELCTPLLCDLGETVWPADVHRLYDAAWHLRRERDEVWAQLVASRRDRDTLLASVREHATQRDHATRHMMSARRERDEARAELDAVRDALLTVREDGETCAAAVARLLEESESQLVALRRQGAEVEEARRELDAAVQRAERAERRLAFTEEWYGCRWERLRDLIRGTHYEEIACQIMANGTPHQDETGEVVYEPPSYESQLNAQRHRASAAEERARRAEAEAARLREVVDAARELASWDWLWLLREDCEHSDDVRVDAERLDAALARLDGGG